MALCSNQSEVQVTRKATQGKRFHFFFSNNNYRELVMPDEMMLLNQLSAVGVEPTAYVYVKAPDLPPGAFGNYALPASTRFDAAFMSKFVLPLAPTLSMVYICGPQSLYAVLTKALNQIGVGP